MGTLATILQVLLLIVGLFLILIILLQRGRGGGLAGAFGGTGGQSAFGTKAGDLFTWITVGAATLWVLLAGVSGCVMRKSESEFGKKAFPSAQTIPDVNSPEGVKEETKTDDGMIPETKTPATDAAPATPSTDAKPAETKPAEPAAETKPATPMTDAKPALETPAATPPAAPAAPPAAPAETPMTTTPATPAPATPAPTGNP